MISGANNISVRLTRVSVGVAVLLSILISTGELAIEIQKQKSLSKASVIQMANAVSPLASKVAYELNTYSAEDVISGLFVFPTVISAEILGDQEQVLARKKRSVVHPASANLLNRFFSELEFFQLVEHDIWPLMKCDRLSRSC